MNELIQIQFSLQRRAEPEDSNHAKRMKIRTHRQLEVEQEQQRQQVRSTEPINAWLRFNLRICVRFHIIITPSVLKKGDHRKPVQFVAKRKGKERKKQKLSILQQSWTWNNVRLCRTVRKRQWLWCCVTHTHCMALVLLPPPSLAFASAIFDARQTNDYVTFSRILASLGGNYYLSYVSFRTLIDYEKHQRISEYKIWCGRNTCAPQPGRGSATMDDGATWRFYYFICSARAIVFLLFSEEIIIIVHAQTCAARCAPVANWWLLLCIPNAHEYSAPRYIVLTLRSATVDNMCNL